MEILNTDDLYYLLLIPLIIGIMPVLDMPTGKTYKQALKEMMRFKFKERINYEDDNSK